MKNFFLLYLIFIESSLSCTIFLSNKIISTSKETLPIGVEITNCTPNSKTLTTKMLSQFNGKIKNSIILNELQSKIDEEFVINSGVTEFINIEATLRNNHNKNNLSFEVSQIFLPQNISLNSYNDVEILCQDCQQARTHQAKLNLKKHNGENLVIPFTVETKHLVRSYRVLKYIPAFTNNIDRTYIEEIYTTEQNQSPVFNEIENLHFFTTNKGIPPNNLLLKSDLSPKIIVRSGDSIELIFENNMIKIKTFGISRSSGYLGQKVEIYQKEKNKLFSATIIDNNKALVNL
jgi:flagella basal body P-ring formation protein FlgA